MFGIFDIDTYNIGTSQGLRCSGHLRCSNFARKSNFAKLAMFDFKRTIAKKAELRKIPRPSRSSRISPNLRESWQRLTVRLPFVQPLSLTPFDSSPSRGASGETVHFAGTAKASPTRGGGSASALTERLYKDGPALCSKARPFAPYRASGVQWKVARPAKASPSGRGGIAKQ